jgi:alcohol dehydrogenase (cytochrome c)
MRTHSAIFVAVLVAAGAVLESQQPAPSTASPAFSARELAALPRANWLKNGGNLFNQNYSPLTQINRDTVASVKGFWRTRLNGSGVAAKYSGEAQPVVHDGVIYIVTGADDVFALGVKTGGIIWSHKAALPDAIPTVCCGWTSRGVALGGGKVYVGQLDGRLVALDERSGEPAWSIQAERWQNGYTITAAPLYYNGMVIVGFSGGENGTRGRVKAYDAKDGRLIWTFYTIPGPGEIGHETWPQNNEAWLHGGATVWQTPAVDPELGMIYFTTGNPGPDFNGKIRAGDNLFATSMVAIDAATGKYRWHFQQIHHDLWDYDGPSPVVLFDVMINGTLRKAAAEPNKAGRV